MNTEEQRPLVSIVIPVKNRTELVTQCLQSVRAQSYENWEAIVADDGSEPPTIQAVEAQSQLDGRIRLIRRSDGASGAPACRNLGLAHSRGELVIFLDSDDLMEADCLSGRVAVMREHPEIDVAMFPSEMFSRAPGDMGRYWNAFTDEDDLDRLLRADTPWQTAGPIWRREAVRKLGGWDESALCWQDWELHCRALIAEVPFLKVPRRDHHYRFAADQSIGSTERRCDRLTAIARQIVKVAGGLKSAGKWSDLRRRWLLGLMIEHAEQCVEVSRRPCGSLRIMTWAWRAGLMGPGRWLESMAYFFIHGWGVPFRWYANRRFFERWLVYRSPTRANAAAPYIPGRIRSNMDEHDGQAAIS